MYICTYVFHCIFTAGMDYTVTASVFNVTISAGATSSSFNIDIIDDITHEDNETFNIAIGLLPSCLSLSLGTSSSTVMIIDNDGEYTYVRRYTAVNHMPKVNHYADSKKLGLWLCHTSR